MARRRAESLGLVKLEHVVVTPESAPLIMFGSAASGEVEALLQARGIAIETTSYAHETGDGALILTPGYRGLEAGEVVALPLIEGPGITGLPCDERGFIPIDDRARVRTRRTSTQPVTERHSRSSRAASPPSKRMQRRSRSPRNSAHRWTRSRSGRCCEASS